MSAALVQALVSAWRTGTAMPFATAVALAPASSAEAYAVQQGVADSLDWFPAGRPRAWKMGGSRDTEPTAAGIPDAALLASPAALPALGHVMTGIEVELAVRLARPLLPGCGAGEAAAAVGEVLAAIEICDERALDWPRLPALFRLADQQMHRCLILGSGIAGPWQDDYARGEVVLELDGQELARQHGGHPLGHPLHLLPWLATHSGGLAAGDIVTTGTWTGLHPAGPGARVQARFAGIGTVACTLARA